MLKFLKVHYQVSTIFKKNEILKQADFASEWQKSRFQGLEIFLWDAAIESPLLKTLIHAGVAT